MSALVCVSQSDADNYSAAIDGKLGYPVAGIDIGGGSHVAPALSVTSHYGAVQKHPTLAEWSYPYDGTVQAQAIALPVGATVQTLDASWTPVVQIAQAQVGS